MGLSAIGVLRHACLRSGGCCQDGRVLLAEQEKEGVVARARALGIEAPLDADGLLAKVDGRCAMLDADNSCRLHATFGPEGKPAVCRQFPWVAVRVGDEVRVGVDPACSSAWRTQDGPDQPPNSLVAGRVDLPDALARQEAVVLAALGAPSLVGALERMGLTPRWAVFSALLAARAAALRPAIERGAPAVRQGLLPQLERWTATAEAPQLSPEREAWALESARRMVALRLTHGVLPPAVAALLCLYAASACAWWSEDDAAWSTSLASWLRALRSPVFVGLLLTDGRALGELTAR